MMKNFLILIVLIALVIPLCACSTKASETHLVQESAKEVSSENDLLDEKTKVLGLVLLNRRDEFYLDLETKIVSEAERVGFKVHVIDTDGDMAKRVYAIEELVQQKVDIIATAGDKMLVKTVEVAVDEGIPVICFDGDIPGDKISTFIGFDYVADGRSVGNWAKEFILENYSDNEEVQIAVLDYPNYSDIYVERTNAFKEVIKTIPNARIVAQQNGSASRAESMTAMERILELYPDIKLVYGINFDTAAGAFAAFKAKGINDVVVCASASWGQEAARYLEANHPQMMAFSFINPYSMATDIVKACVEILEGKKVERKRIHNATLYTYNNISELDWRKIVDERIE